MTVPSTPRRAGPFSGTGTQTAFPFSFRVFSASDIKVLLADADGLETVQTLTADYTVTINADQDTSPGGTVTMVAAPSADEALAIVGATPYSQTLDLPAGGAYSPRALENALDRTVFQVQQLAEEVDRALTLPATAAGASTVLPAPESSRLIGWDAGGQALQNYDAGALLTASAFANWVPQKFTGDGSRVSFTLNAAPGSLGNIDVSVGGVTQTATDDYSLAGNVLTFTSAPANGVVVFVRYGSAAVQGVQGSIYETRVATAGQTVFTTATAWTPGANMVKVYVDGARVTNFTEGAANTLTFITPLTAGRVVLIEIGTAFTGVPTTAALQHTTSGGSSGALKAFLDEMRPSVKWYGATGNGVTNDAAAFRAALLGNAAGGVLRLPKGVYRLGFSEVTGFSIPAGLTLEGDGKTQTEIILAPDSSTYRNGFAIGANVTLRNLKVTLQVPTGGMMSVFVGDYNGFLLDDCYFDGGMTNSGTTLSHVSFGMNFPPSGSAGGITMRNCDVTKFEFFFLKTNTSTSAQRRISVEHCDFFANYREDCSFNSPAGIMDDIQVYACHFRDSRSIEVGLTGLYAAFASCTNFRVALCDFQGPTTDAIHIEENCQRGTVTGNTLLVDGNGIVIQDNNIAGTYTMPLDLAITGNVVTKQGTQKEASTYGIWLVNDATPETPAKRVAITGNTVTGFFAGIQSGATGDDACLIADNVAHGCARGFAIMEFIGAVQDNTSSACDVGVFSGGSSAILRHRFIENTANVQVGSRAVHLVDPAFVWAEFAISAGATLTRPMFPLTTNSRLYGEWATTVVSESGADHANRRDLQVWDGTTHTRTNRITLSPGVFVLDVVNSSGNAAVSLFAASARTTVRLAAAMTGSVVVAA